MGVTLLGTILSSDKTQISAMTSHQQAHPLLISLANLDMEFHMKASSHAFLLLALLPIPQFITSSQQVRGFLEDHLIHECLDIILSPLKAAAQFRIMLNDPLGSHCYCFTPLASYIVDTHDSVLVSCVG